MYDCDNSTHPCRFQPGLERHVVEALAHRGSDSPRLVASELKVLGRAGVGTVLAEELDLRGVFQPAR